MRTFLIALVVVSSAAGARAQTTASPAEIGRFEVGIGPFWLGSASFGTKNATETGPSGAVVTLFSATTALNSATGVEARFAVRLSTHFDAEAAGSYAGPHLATTVRGDSEAGAGPFTSDEWVQQFTVGARAVWRLSAPRSHPRLIPFVMGGAQYLRQLHEQQTLLVTGRLYDGGGGVKYLMGSREHARLKTVGLRGDVRAVVRTAGVNTDGRAHVSAAFAASLFVRF